MPGNKISQKKKALRRQLDAEAKKQAKKRQEKLKEIDAEAKKSATS